MKKLLLLIVFFPTLITFSQENSINVSLKKSAIFKEKKESVIMSVSKDSNNNLYIVRKLERKKGYLFELYNQDFNLIKSHEHKLEKRHDIAGGYLKGNKVGYIEYYKNKKEKKIEAFLYESSVKGLVFTKKRIFEVSTEGFPNFFDRLFSSSKIDNNFEGNLTFSKSGEYNVFNIDSYNKEKENHKILVFDKDFNKLWEKDFKTSHKDKNFNLQNIKISDNAEVFILGKVSDKKKRKKEGGKYHYELFKISESETKTTSLSVDEHFAATLELNFTNQDKISCIGFYSDKNDNRFKGVSAFIINPKDLSIISKKFSPFTEQFLTDKYGKKKDKELRNIEFKNIEYTEDGNMIITAEEFFIRTHYVHSQYGGYTTTSYNFDDIIVLKIDKQGKLLWARNINKAQTASYFSDPLMSYGTAQYKNNGYLILNAHKKIGELSGGRIKFRESFLWKATKNNTNLYIGKFDTNGDFTYKVLLKNKDEDTVFNCRYVEQISENELVLFGQRKRKKQFLKITIN